jgi:hypothetical protein
LNSTYGSCKLVEKTEVERQLAESIKNRRGRKSKADNQEVGTLILRFANRYVLCGQGWLLLSPHHFALAQPSVDYGPSARYRDAELNGTTPLSPQQLDNRTRGMVWQLHSLLPEELEENDLSECFGSVPVRTGQSLQLPWIERCQ